MKNMKIKVETDEHGESNLDEIVGQLERLGYKQNKRQRRGRFRFVIADSDGIATNWFRDTDCDFYKLTTLAELRSMNIETLKEM